MGSAARGPPKIKDRPVSLVAPHSGHLSRDGLRPVALREDDTILGTCREVPLDLNFEKNVDDERTGQLDGKRCRRERYMNFFRVGFRRQRKCVTLILLSLDFHPRVEVEQDARLQAGDRDQLGSKLPRCQFPLCQVRLEPPVDIEQQPLLGAVARVVVICVKEPASHLLELAVRLLLQPTGVNHLGWRQLFEPPPERKTVEEALELLDECLHLLDGHLDRVNHLVHCVFDCLWGLKTERSKCNSHP
eukprot:scaffold6955_cov63-Phaeocystis_antarctica.AAC.3